MESTIVKTNESICLYAKSLEGLKLIVKQTVERTEKVYNVDENGKEHFSHKNGVTRKNEMVEFPLTEVSVDAIQELRDSGNPVFLYKENNKLYYTELPAKIHYDVLLAGEHQCASATSDCRRLSAETDERGGCKKVRDRHLKLENYPFIKKGYQVFNTSNNCLVVLECKNFEETPSKQINNESLANAMEAAKQLWKNFRNINPKSNDDDDEIFPKHHN